MSFEWLPILEEDLLKYKRDMQEAFQKGYEADYGKTTNIILPEADIEWSLTTNGAITYKAVVDGKIVGGAIVVIDEIVFNNIFIVFKLIAVYCFCHRFANCFWSDNVYAIFFDISQRCKIIVWNYTFFKS